MTTTTSTKGLVLVTGANGFIAAQTIAALLAAGYSVRGTVRSLSSAAPILAALPQYASRLSFAAVPDITTPGAFDDAIKDVTAVAHLASPVSFSFTDPVPVLAAAISGTLRILEAASAEPSVKSFIYMSSITAILSGRTENYTYTEDDWNTFAEEMVRDKGKDTPGRIIYAASKVAAERALWRYKEERKPGFSVMALNPCFVAGPPLVVPDSIEGVAMSSRIIPDVFVGKGLDEAGYPGVYDGYVDVRDVARVVVFGAENPEKVDGERFLLAGHYSPAQAVADILRREYPDKRDVVVEGTPGVGYNSDYSFSGVVYDGTKVVRVTGQEYIPWEKTVVDTVEKLRPILS